MRDRSVLQNCEISENTQPDDANVYLGCVQFTDCVEERLRAERKQLELMQEKRELDEMSKLAAEQEESFKALDEEKKAMERSVTRMRKQNMKETLNMHDLKITVFQTAVNIPAEQMEQMDVSELLDLQYSFKYVKEMFNMEGHEIIEYMETHSKKFTELLEMAEFADAIDMTVSSVVNIRMSDVVFPEEASLEKLLQMLDMDVSELIEYKHTFAKTFSQLTEDMNLAIAVDMGVRVVINMDEMTLNALKNDLFEILEILGIQKDLSMTLTSFEVVKESSGKNYNEIKEMNRSVLAEQLKPHVPTAHDLSL